MKVFNIPLIEEDFTVYVGSKEYLKWRNEIIEGGFTHAIAISPPESFNSGRQYLGLIWINGYNIEVLFHEVQHFLDELFTIKDIEDEREFKARIAGNVHKQITKWIISKKKKFKWEKGFWKVLIDSLGSVCYNMRITGSVE